MESVKEVEYIFFYSEKPERDEYPCFSNFYPATYSINDIKFPTSEHGFMYSKAKLFNDDIIAEEILHAETPKDAKDLGRKVKGFENSIWDKHKKKIMFMHCYAKFFTIRKLHKIITNTNNKLLVEASPRDKIWGIGVNVKSAHKLKNKNWKTNDSLGNNYLGEALMKVRKHLLKENTKKFKRYVSIYFA